METYTRKLPMPPETHRDYIFSACKFIKQSDWKNCYEAIESLRAWEFVPKNIEFKETLLKGIKQASLSVFLNDYNESYPNITK
mmetsp:Transcript_16747/g.2740  ORF Transcript_16747/g.2740 Transcript_16747/m.2740 type:complete len:83 (+) Transcript_16747:1877-2125(+)